MDFLTGKIRPMYFKYLAAAFGSAVVWHTFGIYGVLVLITAVVTIYVLWHSS